MPDTKSLYKKFIEARQAAWGVHDLLIRYGKANSTLDLDSNSAYQKATKHEHDTWVAYLDAPNDK